MGKILTRSRAACTMMANNDQNTDDIQESVIKYFDRKFNELQEGFPSKVFFEEIKNFMIEQMNKIEKLDSTLVGADMNATIGSDSFGSRSYLQPWKKLVGNF